MYVDRVKQQQQQNDCKICIPSKGLPLKDDLE